MYETYFQRNLLMAFAKHAIEVNIFYQWNGLISPVMAFCNKSVTRLGDLLDFGPLFKALSNNQFAQISHILRQLL